MRGADLLVKTLAAAGVRKIFSLSGNQIMPVYDACIDAGIEIVHTRHEAAAVFMADAWAQLTGEIGVALVTAAPGAANAFAALYTARQSESPVLLLTGDSPRTQDGSGAFQELDQVSISVPLTKLSMRCTAAATIGDDVARSISTALSGRPGPVHLALPFDVLQHDAGEKSLPDPTDYARTLSAPAEDSIDSLLQMLRSAERPLVLCGASLNDTRFGDENARLSNAIGAPVVAMESPRGLKDPSLGDLAKAVLRADFILSLGKPVDFTVGFGAQSGARWLLVDADASEHQRARKNLGERLASFPLADPRAVATALTSRACDWEPKAAWRAEVGELLAARNFSTESSRTGPITPAALCAVVQRHIERESETVVICDGGEFGQWAQACTHGTHRVINGPSGAIGGGLCYAVAAKKAKPSATVFAFMGDGTIGFHLAEFETAARERAPFIAIIGNDQCWNAEHQIQLREYGPKRLIGCQLSDARYDKAVEGLGGHGEYVRDLAELDAALHRAVASGKPACINVVIEGVPAPSGHSH